MPFFLHGLIQSWGDWKAVLGNAKWPWSRVAMYSMFECTGHGTPGSYRKLQGRFI